MKKEVGTYTGKTPEDAFDAAKEEYSGKGALTYEVIERGKPGGFLGIGAIKAKIVVYAEEEGQAVEPEEKSEPVAREEAPAAKNVSVPANENGQTDGERAVEFLKGLLPFLHIDATPALTKEDEKIEITLQTENTHGVIGKRGIVLDAIQNLTGAVANIGRDDYKRVVVDCDGYREKRDETLARVAQKTADKAVRLGKKVRLEPMSAYERRIIHAALADSDKVKTSSEGKEPYRYIVVIPNELKPYERSYDKRNNNGGRRDYRGNGGNGNRNNGRRDNRDNRGNGGRPPVRKARTYSDEEKAERSKVSGGTSAHSSSGDSSYKKSSSIVFGTYLGNSRKNEEE